MQGLTRSLPLLRPVKQDSIVDTIQRLRILSLVRFGVHMENFKDDDAGYLRWVEDHSDGYVVNCYRTPSPSYLKLHRATCRWIQTEKWTNYTTKTYMKVCSSDKAELDTWARHDIDGELDPCKHCNP